MRAKTIAAATLPILVLAAGASRGDYDTHPELRPEARCAGLEDPDSPSGYSADCQPLFWDLPAATAAGQRAVAAPDLVHGFLRGRIDRPPPLYTDGTNGYETPGPGRWPLCDHPDDVPFWQPTGESETIYDETTGTREAEVYEVACRRGSRAYFGPWFLGSDPTTFDGTQEAIVRFDNHGRLARDVAAGRIGPTERREWNVSSEVYTHHAAHHGFCDISVHRCNDASDPEYEATSTPSAPRAASRAPRPTPASATTTARAAGAMEASERCWRART